MADNSTLLTEAFPYLLKEYMYWNSTDTGKRVTVGACSLFCACVCACVHVCMCACVSVRADSE